MAASMLVKQRQLNRIVGRRRGLRRRLVGALLISSLAARNRRFDAVGGRVGRTSFGDSTPASRARRQLAHRASGSAAAN
jgi:hypothetical protein